MAKKNALVKVESDGSEKLLEEMIERYSTKRAIDWLRVKFPSFDTGRAEAIACDATKNEKDYFAAAELLGYVTRMPQGKTDDTNRPLLVAAVKMKKDMTERTSRLVQFNFAKKILQSAVTGGARGLNGLPSQGLFFFYDKDGYFRLSLVSGEVEKRRFKFNEAKRQSFYVEPCAANNIVKRRLTPAVRAFDELKDVFSVEQLTKEFYTRLFDWYTWAMSPRVNVHFPNDLDDKTDDRKYNNEALIRMITRLMFTWFIRQRKLVPDEIFDREALDGIIKKFEPDSMEQDNYYRAILQNLFFATFNCPQTGKGKLKRRWIDADVGTDGDGVGLSDDYGVKTVYRYKDQFKNADAFLEMMKRVPFLNCALFDCLDKVERKEDGGRKLYFDGFSTKKKRQAYVPNGLFFDKERGIISLFNRYEFTVNENNADDSDVALDPELLGKVFENLLGAYNPETRETARNATGSFYTPREIVDYMVEESLKNYLKTKVPAADDKRLEDLFDRSKAAEGAETQFSGKEKDALLNALYECKILDPACGSGAFPMGVLHCMVRLLTRLDPQSLSIRQHLLDRYRVDKAVVDPTESAADREERLAELESRLREGQHYPDYERKLYLIENCIYGVDIQPIATQISKLRFFISLLCDQLRTSYDPDAENFGLLSLPNLEAKFVCANTLISLPEVGALDASVGNIAELRRELQSNRHKIFRARSTRTKEKYKNKDLEIRDAIRATVKDSLSKPDEDVIAKCREQIADAQKRRAKVAEPKWVEEEVAVQADLFSTFEKKKVLKDRNAPARDKIDAEISWAEETIKKELSKGDRSNVSAATRYADMVAGWDPYDQNASSPFFDPEWMFNNTTGFDVVIGNPPYGAELSEDDKKYCADHYLSARTIQGRQKGSLDTFSLFVERAFRSTVHDGTCIYILPMAIVSSGSMTALHRMLFENCARIKCSSYAVRPQPVFENAVVNTTIFGFIRTDTPLESVLTTKMYRKGHLFDLATLVRNLSFAESIKFLLPGRIPKIGLKIEETILDKLLRCERLRSYLCERGRDVYYRSSGGRYFKVVTDYSTGSNKEKRLVVRSDYSKVIGACLSSNLGFWFYQIYSNNLDWKSEEILAFPIPDISRGAISHLNKLYDKYTHDIELHANKRDVSAGSKYTMDTFKEYKIGFSKKIIDEIDDFIGPLYGLTKEEIEFIKNYEIEFRLSDDDMVKASGVDLKPTAPKSERPRRTPAPTAAVAADEDDEELE